MNTCEVFFLPINHIFFMKPDKYTRDQVSEFAKLIITYW